MTASKGARAPQTTFVLGGGGSNGAAEVGGLRALLERGIQPDLILGTSVGAINGAAVAADPTVDGVEQLRDMWLNLDDADVFGGSIFSGAAQLFRTRTHLHSNQGLRRMLSERLPERFEDLKVPFACVAASIERAAEHWFTSGPLPIAILASAAVPGVLPAVEIDGEHFVDGGIVNSIPVSRAVESGARDIFVLQVGRLEAPLEPPRTPVQVGLVAFEIARRHRFSRDMATLPKRVRAHVLPTGDAKPPKLSQLNYRNFRSIAERIDRAYEAASAYLDALPSHP